MLLRRILELVGMLLIGDAVVGLLRPRRHTRLWTNLGPQAYRDAMKKLERRPQVLQMMSLVEAVIGFWLAARQEPR